MSGCKLSIDAFHGGVDGSAGRTMQSSAWAGQSWKSKVILMEIVD